MIAPPLFSLICSIRISYRTVTGPVVLDEMFKAYWCSCLPSLPDSQANFTPPSWIWSLFKSKLGASCGTPTYTTMGWLDIKTEGSTSLKVVENDASRVCVCVCMYVCVCVCLIDEYKMLAILRRKGKKPLEVKSFWKKVNQSFLAKLSIRNTPITARVLARPMVQTYKPMYTIVTQLKAYCIISNIPQSRYYNFMVNTTSQPCDQTIAFCV